MIFKFTLLLFWCHTWVIAKAEILEIVFCDFLWQYYWISALTPVEHLSWFWYPVWSNIIRIWPPVSLGWRPSLWHLHWKSVESKEKNSFLQSEVCPRVLYVLMPIPTAHNSGMRAPDVRKEVPPCQSRLFGHSRSFTVLCKFGDPFVKFLKSTQVSSKDSKV